MKIIINGRFLTQNITGVQRVAHEIIKELDKITKEKSLEVIILAPRNIIFNNLYENIKVKKSWNIKRTFMGAIRTSNIFFFRKRNFIKFMQYCSNH